MADISDSHLVSEITHDSDGVEAMPVLIGSEVWAAQTVDGGYDEEEDVHVLQLSSPTTGEWGAPAQTGALNYEVHTENYAWSLTVPEHHTTREDDTFTLTLGVEDYEKVEVSFEEELNEDVDKRETRYEK